MAQDILAVTASGVSVEWVFNMSQDVCSYHCGQLNASTIKMLLIIKYYEQKALQSLTDDEEDIDIKDRSDDREALLPATELIISEEEEDENTNLVRP